MLDQNEILLIRELYYAKHSPKREIARILRRSRKTVGRWIANENPAPRKKSGARQFLESHRKEVEAHFLECNMNCRPLQHALAAQYGENVSMRMLQRFCSDMRRKP